MVERPLMVRWVDRSIPYNGSIELFFGPASLTKAEVCAILYVAWCI